MDKERLRRDTKRLLAEVEPLCRPRQPSRDDALALRLVTKRLGSPAASNLEATCLLRVATESLCRPEEPVVETDERLVQHDRPISQPFGRGCSNTKGNLRANETICSHTKRLGLCARHDRHPSQRAASEEARRQPNEEEPLTMDFVLRRVMETRH